MNATSIVFLVCFMIVSLNVELSYQEDPVVPAVGAGEDTVTTAAAVTVPSTCVGKQPWQAFQDPDSCNHYYMCNPAQSAPVHGKCMGNLVFDSATKTCVVTASVACTVTTAAPTASTAAVTTTRDPALPTTCNGRTVSVYQDSQDSTCKKFWICLPGQTTPVASRCMGSLTFVAASGGCVVNGACTVTTAAPSGN